MIEKQKNKVLIGRHCLMKFPNFLRGSVEECVGYGGNCLMINLGAPQNTKRRKVTELKKEDFLSVLLENNIELKNVIVHAPYLINVGNTLSKEKFDFSKDFLLKEVRMMEEIGLETIVLHPGNSLDNDKWKALDSVVKALDYVLENSSGIRIALETMSGKGTELGNCFEDFVYIFSKVKFRGRVGICWDTCHLFSSGYDLKEKLDEVIEEFNSKIGINKLWVIHLNDSLFDLGSRRDRHENIGYGKIGYKAIKRIVNHERLSAAIKILETPRKREVYKNEIRKLLK